MLDKSVPYKNIIMKLDAALVPSISNPILPEGYAFRHFRDGDEANWARIETAVLEFATQQAALEYFKKNYLSCLAGLKKRCVFVFNKEGLPIATATAWFDYGKSGLIASLHWVAVCPEYQGLGIGEAVVKKVLQIIGDLGPFTDVYLHTQTWSYKAVNLYRKLGFIMLKKEKIKGSGNDYPEAIKILKALLLKDAYLALVNTAK